MSALNGAVEHMSVKSNPRWFMRATIKPRDLFLSWARESLHILPRAVKVRDSTIPGRQCGA